jgi:2-polyprenyl-3-methyl-5-hydroxy-6-metoxy-1,4-benzoquinol methylase
MERTRDQFASFRTRSLAKKLSANSPVLDVGCGDGRLLRSLAGHGDFVLFGVELPGKAADRAAAVPGINLHVGSLETARFPSEQFELVTLVHVFEHLSHPRHTVRELARIIKPGGALLIAYPNCQSWQASIFKGSWFHLDPPRHLTLVPPKALEEALAELGFHLERSSHERST